ncbi:DUF6445 family protein [Pseudoalteromonas sp. S16_S37]|uniref:DUF6445 family protein n=1 Tax=Pseudoalteromonas sp. S16_S37 TaxID=2720228 RepID=UPI001680ED05|nr:DUF6445 family protein [Pseudoalteromonas sp. S16_S37]MBD1582916.1 hypothetical protein [Pseudoalteromonas sp. S16_S37]
MKELKLHESIKITKLNIPETEKHVYIIDDFLDSLDSIFDFAYNIAYFNPMFAERSFFPGIRDSMPMPYMRGLERFFTENILTDLSNDYDKVIFHRSLLSLVTCTPDKLVTEQRMPHIDTFDALHFAFVHYLYDEDFGGTSIYKYKPVNLIEFNEEHAEHLRSMVEDVNNYPNEHAGYINESTSIFEQVLKIEAKKNRLVIYPGNILHSANIKSDNDFSRDPKKGRLSISSFATITK